MQREHWNERRNERHDRLHRAQAALGLRATDKVVGADDIGPLLDAVLVSGDRVCREGNNQKQADFLARALLQVWPERTNDLHMVQSVLALPEHLDVFERGIASRLDFSFSGPQGARLAKLAAGGNLQIGAIHTYQMDINTYMLTLGKQARAASRQLAAASTEAKNTALLAMASEIRQRAASLLEANARDLNAAREAGLDAAMIDRLTLTAKGVEAIAPGLGQVAALPDPVGEITDVKRRPSGIQVGKMRVPLGVIGIIYEARPNVTADAAALCLKSGNAAILRGGKEALHCNQAIPDCVRAGLKAAGLPERAVQVVDTTDRAAVGASNKRTSPRAVLEALFLRFPPFQQFLADTTPFQKDQPPAVPPAARRCSTAPLPPTRLPANSVEL